MGRSSTASLPGRKTSPRQSSRRARQAARAIGRGERWPALARFAVAMAGGSPRRAAHAIRDARRSGSRRVVLEETALMLVLYAGYPAALEGMRVLNETWPGRARAARDGGVTRWRLRGEAACRRVYGEVYPRLVARVRALHPDLADWMVEQGYGRVLSRSGLSMRNRELITVAVLASAGWEPQLVSHLLGARRVGCRASEIRRALVIGAHNASARTQATARRAWSKTQSTRRRISRVTRGGRAMRRSARERAG